MNLAPQPERRRDIRQEKNLSLKLKWDDSQGIAHFETIQTESINAYGCMFFLESKIADGTEIELMNPATKRKCEARVIWCGETDPQGRTHVGIELVEPGPDFWSVQMQPKAGEEKVEKNYPDAWVD